MRGDETIELTIVYEMLMTLPEAMRDAQDTELLELRIGPRTGPCDLGRDFYR